MFYLQTLSQRGGSLRRTEPAQFDGCSVPGPRLFAFIHQDAFKIPYLIWVILSSQDGKRQDFRQRAFAFKYHLMQLIDPKLLGIETYHVGLGTCLIPGHFLFTFPEHAFFMRQWPLIVSPWSAVRLTELRILFAKML